MSLGRLVYYAAVVSGWAAFIGWLLAELIILRGDAERGGTLGLALVGGIVGAAIGAGLSVASGLGNQQWQMLLKRVPMGLVGGGAGGLLGILLGNLAYTHLHLPRFLGFVILGLGVGVVDGIYEQSPRKLRNGLIGGLMGGLVGGLLYMPMNSLINSNTGMPSRMIAFVVLGIAIGAMIGLVQVVLREAWLTVVDGYRPGRQFILAQKTTVLGRAEHLPLPFLGPSNSQVTLEHLQIVRQPQGEYWLEDMTSALGTYLNHQRISGTAVLTNGDLIKLGTNLVRFNERRSSGDTTEMPPDPGGQGPEVGYKAPPPPPQRTRKSEPAPGPVVRTPTATSTPKKRTETPGRKNTGPPPPPPPRRS